ncbi:Npun_R2821/Npun_R2822 family protein [Trichocoleus sp. FACHB-262]|uniref:Npun_R2821/Npun_R2822 family protein n=1 Tax=Trichocoleus sp. FACHB-262 TaxID=2692869 RepID=UPI001685305F|nr:Npun_R2821/Npun_R2822 family protein [Trichocoleus sp. FACHB-262]MBD2124132.1 sugar transferase [Trichocoleus sp. FACHB-262]
MVDGIYTLANDVVYNQLVALLNSIEVNVGSSLPVCVIAYDDRADRVRAEIATRKNVTLLEDPALLTRWEDFSSEVWATHPTALKTWERQEISGVYRLGMHRRFCAFDPDALFERFIYLDADTLVMNSLDNIFSSLDHHDFIVYDFQYKSPRHAYNLQSSRLQEIFPEPRIKSEIFCAGMYASKRGIFDQNQRNWLISQLQADEAEVLCMSAPDQSVLNYMVMRSQIPVHNLALNLPKNQITGNAVTSNHFIANNNILYDKDSQLTYLHYIGLSSKLFNQICDGENVDFPYRDIFLHYRYLHESEKRPHFKGKPKLYNAPPSLTKRVMKKLGLAR